MSNETNHKSLSEFHSTVKIPNSSSTWIRRMFVFAGPAYLVSVGYMDPGNWATDLAGGSRFGYQLIWVLLMSNLIAVLLQTLAARLGVVTGKDLAQACRDEYPRWMTIPLWLMCEVAIVACDLAEVLGAAIGLQLLFGLPLLAGVLITSFDVLLLLSLSRLGMRRLESIIVVMVVTIGGCFAIEMLLARPDIAAIVTHLLPRDAGGALTLFSSLPGEGWAVLGLHRESLFIAMGILGATVMPHNLYLHSSLVQSRAVASSGKAKREAVRHNLVDSVIALNAAFFVNAAILILAASVFYKAGLHDVADLKDAHRLLAPLLGTSLASTVFAIALLTSGQASTITGTLAGQIVMEGFLRIRIRPWLRRIISRGLAIIPAVFVIILQGEGAVNSLLILSQVVLSLQLSFAVLPLIMFTSDRRKMGEFVNPLWVILLAGSSALIILSLNGLLVAQNISGWLTTMNGLPRTLVLITLVPVVTALATLLGAILFLPWLRRVLPRFVASPSGWLPEWAKASAKAMTVPPATPVASGSGTTTVKLVAVALEMGPADAAVLAHLLAMPRSRDAQVVLLHVAESAANRYLGNESNDEEVREDQAMLDKIVDQLNAEGFNARAMLGHGPVVDELARMVNEAGAELLITGSHGHRLIGDLVHGSTTSALRHLVRCPVLTIRAEKPAR